MEPGAEVVSCVEDGEEGVDVDWQTSETWVCVSRCESEEVKGVGEGIRTRASGYAEYVHDERPQRDIAQILRARTPPFITALSNGRLA